MRARSKRAVIDGAAIDAFLATMHYPIAFLDYETYPCGVPRFAGYSSSIRSRSNSRSTSSRIPAAK